MPQPIPRQRNLFSRTIANAYNKIAQVFVGPNNDDNAIPERIRSAIHGTNKFKQRRARNYVARESRRINRRLAKGLN